MNMKLPAAPKDSTFLKAPWNKKAGGKCHGISNFFASGRAPRVEKWNDLDDLMLADLNL